MGQRGTRAKGDGVMGWGDRGWDNGGGVMGWSDRGGVMDVG